MSVANFSKTQGKLDAAIPEKNGTKRVGAFLFLKGISGFFFVLENINQATFPGG